MESVLLQGGAVWDGSGRPAFPADVLVQGNRIAEIWPRAPRGLHADARFDIPGHTVIPGLVEGHAHLPFVHKANIADTGDVPPEEHTLQTLHTRPRRARSRFYLLPQRRVREAAPRCGRSQ